MQSIKLISLFVEGFRGFENSVTFEFSEGLTEFRGVNGEGKTTIGEAIAWAMTGKGLGGSVKNLNIKNINVSKARVVLKFESDGREREIERRLTTSTRIKVDGVEVAQKTVEEEFNSLLFLMLFNPMIFLTLTEGPARSMITKLFSEATLDDVLNTMTSEEQEFLRKETFNVNDTNSYLTALTKKRKNAEDELKHMEGYIQKVSEPIIIKEVEVVSNDRINAIREKIEEVIKDKAKNDKPAESEAQKREIESNIREVKSRAYSGAVEVGELNKDVKRVEVELAHLDRLKPDTKKTDSLHSERNMMLQKYRYEKDKLAELDKEIISLDAATCSACGQKTPPAHIEKRRKEIEASKAIIDKDLLEMVESGKAIKEEIEKTDEANLIIEKNFEKELLEKRKVLKAELDDVLKKLKTHEEKRTQFQKSIEEELSKLVERKKLLEADAANNKTSGANYEEQLISLKQELVKEEERFTAAKKLETEAEIAKKQEAKRAEDLQALIVKREEQEKSMEHMANQAFHMKQFVLAKTTILNAEISKHLKRVSIELESVNQTSGEVRACFNVLYDDKPVHVCSLSEQMRAGMEIVDMISNIKGYKYPLFVDNAESIISYDCGVEQRIEVRVMKGESLMSQAKVGTAPSRVQPTSA